MMLEAGLRGADQLIDAYLGNIRQVEGLLAREPGLKANLYVDGRTHPEEEAVNFSLLLYDAFSVYPLLGDQMKLVQLLPEACERYLGTAQIKVNLPGSIATLLAQESDTQGLRLVLATGSGEQTLDFLRRVAPLAEAGRLLVRPDRGVLGRTGTTEEGKRIFTVFEVDQESPIDRWTIVEDVATANPVLPLRYGGPKTLQQEGLFEISVPFLRGIPYGDLLLILEDEYQHVAKLRAALKSTVTEAQSHGTAIPEVVSDVIRPELDRLGRQFKKVASIHRLKLGGAVVSTAALGLVSFAAGGLVQAAAGLFGAGGIGLIAREIASYSEKKADLREAPLYLLWRIRGSSPPK